MGVRGLSTFFRENPELFKDFKLHDSKVVVDGSNLAHLLYFNKKVNSIYGGDYKKFADAVKEFINMFAFCNVEPIVVFDGCYDKNDRKLRTILDRIEERLRKVKCISKQGNCSGSVFPILAMEVMYDVLNSLNVTVIQCDFEADDQIAAIANYHKCPVISQDSDFYIFDVTHGVIRFDSIYETPLLDIDQSNKEYSYLSCKIYYIHNFLSYFPGTNKEVLPLIGTLIGNDYVHMNTFDNFYANIKLPKFKPRLKVNQRHKKMIGLFNWLQNRSLSDAIGLILGSVKLNDRDRIHTIIKEAINSYEIQQAHNKLDDPRCIVENSLLTTFYNNALPDWFLKKNRIGEIPQFFLHVVCIHKVFLKMQVEEDLAPSSYISSQFVRQVLYGVFLSYDAKLSNISTEECCIVEYDRFNGKLVKNLVKPVFFVDGFGRVPSLDDLYHDVDAKLFLTSVIGDKLSYFDNWPRGMSLFVGITRYWLRKSTIKPTEQFFIALIVHIIYFSISDSANWLIQSTGISTEIGKLIKSINQTDIETFHGKVEKHLRKTIHTKASPVDISIIHSFSQLQTCTLYLMYLNKLIGDAFPGLKVQFLLGGTMLYNLTRDILSRPCPELYASELLGRNTALNELFLKMKEKLLEGMSGTYFSQSKYSHKLKKKKKNVKKVQLLSVHSEQSMIVDEDDIATHPNKFSILNSVNELH